MTNPAPQAVPANPADAAIQSRLRARLANMRTAAVVHWPRTLAFVIAVLVFMGGIGLAWTFTVRLTIEAEREKIKLALAALDKGHHEQARNIVHRVLNSGALPHSEFGTPLFVLGAVKVYDADTDVAADQRRTQYLVASRYLDEARSYGLPVEREKQGLLLLGKCLVTTQQTEQGIDVLQEVLESKAPGDPSVDVAAHRLLAEAYTQLQKPEYGRALEHLKFVVDKDELTPDQQVNSAVLESKVLARLHRYDDALAVIASLPPAAARFPLVLLTRGQLLLESVNATINEMPVQQSDQLPPQLASRVQEAIKLLKEANTLDPHAGEISRRTNYLMARGMQLLGDDREALKLLTRTHQQFGDTSEGLAAKLAEADLLRKAGDDRTALLWYRQILQSDVSPNTYRSEVLPIEALRLRILAAVADFSRNGHYAHAVTMLDNFTPLFSRTQELELRGKTLRQWGESELTQANDDVARAKALQKAGLRRLREAGMAYEKLAKLRFSTSNYADDLWNSADCYYLGHSYTQAARVLDVYLKHEPEKRNAQALLRLGQVNLSLNRIDACIAALEECFELYGRDNATYQARIDCARAYWLRGDATRAEALLRENLDGAALEPRSPEWRDSLFALGQLLYDLNRFAEAIAVLEEAIERYPDDRQTLHARYVTGEAYRRWAEEPLARMATARTNSEREKNDQLYRERLTLALAQFKAVQSTITLKDHNLDANGPLAAMRRNCYMLEGACLFDLGRYQDAIEAYQNVSSLYPNEPFVLETFVQIANCWQRLDRGENANGAIQQAQITLEQLPANANFAATTAFSREEWRMLLKNMSQW